MNALRVAVARVVRRLVAAARGGASTMRRIGVVLSQPAVRLGAGVRLEPGVRFSATDGGTIEVGDRCTLSRGATLIARGGTLRLGAGTFVGPWTMLAAQSAVAIGEDALIAERVTVRDHDHDTGGAIGAPLAGFRTAPVAIGRGAWLGAGAVVVKGVAIGDGAVVGANAVVTKAVAAGAIVVGVPARVIGHRGRPGDAAGGDPGGRSATEEPPGAPR